MIHALLVARQFGKDILFERLYEEHSVAERSALVRDVFQATAEEWEGASAPGVQRVAIVGKGRPVVYVHWADLTFYVVGSGDYDELVLSECLSALLELLSRLCVKGLSESELLANHERISLLVDSVIRHGQLEHTDKDIVQALVAGEPQKVALVMLERSELLTVSCPAYSAPSARTTTKSGKGVPIGSIGGGMQNFYTDLLSCVRQAGRQGETVRQPTWRLPLVATPSSAHAPTPPSFCSRRCRATHQRLSRSRL
jgi:hypothetical protein